MVAKRARPCLATTPDGAGDFTLIQGIGPGIHNRLHAAGICTFAQLGALSTEEILAKVGSVPALTAERIALEDWVGQARAFAERVDLPDPPVQELPANQQHYATYRIELLVDETGSPRRTSITHVQSKRETSWAGWEQARLVDFIFASAGLKAQPDPDVHPASSGDNSSAVAAGPEAQPEADVHPATGNDASPLAAHDPDPVLVSPGEGPGEVCATLQLKEPISRLAAAAEPPITIAGQRPFSLRVTLDLSHADGAPDLLDYAIVMTVKNMGDGTRCLAGRAAGTVPFAHTITTDIQGMPLPPGIYHLRVIATFRRPNQPTALPPLGALMEGTILQVH